MTTLKASEINFWDGSPTAITTYAASFRASPMSGRMTVPASSNMTNSAVVTRSPRRGDIRFFYSHGGVNMYGPINGVAQGGVLSSVYQRVLVQLHDWSIYRLYEAGYPRNLGLSFRVPQLVTNKSGGPTVATMQQRPLFPKVQTVKRAGVTVQTYNTRSANR